jgi:hypothetical protein
MNTYGGVDVQIRIFLTTALAGGEWSASRPGCFTPEKRATNTHWIGGWVNPRTALEDVEKRNTSPYPNGLRWVDFSKFVTLVYTVG